jgi:hypothetical protein
VQKNVTGQKVIVFAFDATTNLQKSGDAANITAYISKDFGAVTALTDTSATEMDATNAKGYYLFDITQTETNADLVLVTAKSSTANIVVIGAPSAVFTTPANFTAASIDSNGRVDVIKVAGTTQTARDLGASVLISSGSGVGQLDVTSGVVKANTTQLAGQTVTAGAGVTFPASVASPTNITAATGITVATNSDKTGYSIASGGIISGAHAAAELNAIADAHLDRNMATGTDSGTNSTAVRTPRQALRQSRNKVTIAAGTMTTFKEDDATTSHTAAVTTTAGDPISAVDPT